MATIGPFKLHSTAASAALTGTLTASATEADIVAGGKTLIITLTGATWVAAGATFDAIRQDIINGLDSAQAEATGWDALVVPALAVTDVLRTSDTVVTITLPAVATYDITADETITVTVPASATSATSAIVAAPTVVIAYEVVVGCPFEAMGSLSDDGVSLYGTNPIWGAIKTMNDFCKSQFRFSPDGLKIFFPMDAVLLPDFSGFTKYGLAQADLTTPFDLSTISNLVEHDLETPGVLFDGGDWFPGDILHISTDGHYVIMRVFGGPTIAEAVASLHLSTAFDVTTASQISITPNADFNLEAAMFLSASGDYGWYIGTQNDTLKSFRLTTPYNFDTMIIDNTESLPVGALNPTFIDVACDNGGIVLVDSSGIEYVPVNVTINGDGTISISAPVVASSTSNTMIPAIFTRSLRTFTVANDKLVCFGWNFSPDPLYEMARISI